LTSTDLDVTAKSTTFQKAGIQNQSDLLFPIVPAAPCWHRTEILRGQRNLPPKLTQSLYSCGFACPPPHWDKAPTKPD